ncbi:hypothetical protein GYMLUDRAFT_236108 [Collybiopsis luxurians FD-317 M1]|nr:hypothetical protein GYMLUDRAFT_236108 [Collybiopsis luxurians FD-317 M1]
MATRVRGSIETENSEVKPLGSQILSLQNWICRRCVQHSRQSNMSSVGTASQNIAKKSSVDDKRAVSRASKPSQDDQDAIVISDSDSDEVQILGSKPALGPSSDSGISTERGAEIQSPSYSMPGTSALSHSPGPKFKPSYSLPLPRSPSATQAAHSGATSRNESDKRVKPDKEKYLRSVSASADISIVTSGSSPFSSGEPASATAGANKPIHNHERTAKKEIAASSTVLSRIKMARAARKVSSTPLLLDTPVHVAGASSGTTQPLSQIIERLHRTGDQKSSTRVGKTDKALDDRYSLVAPHICQWILAAEQTGEAGEDQRTTSEGIKHVTTAEVVKAKTRGRSKPKARRFDFEKYSPDLLNLIH